MYAVLCAEREINKKRKEKQTQEREAKERREYMMYYNRSPTKPSAQQKERDYRGDIKRNRDSKIQAPPNNFGSNLPASPQP